MADETENVVIKVTETGSDDVAAKLTRIGTAGDEAGKKAAAGIGTAGSAYSSFAAQLGAAAAAAQQSTAATAALSQATQATAQAAQGAAQATQGQAAALQGQATAAGAAATATQGAAAANQAAAASATTHNTQVRSLASSYSALSEAVRLAAVLLSARLFEKTIDSATTIDETLKRLTKTTGDYDTVYQRLLATANSTGQSIGSTVNLFNSLTVAVAGTKTSHNELLLAVDSIQKALLLSGVSAEHVSRVMRDLTEAAAQGTLTSRQLVTILAQAPGVMEIVEQATGLTTKALLDQSSAHTKASASAHLLTTELTAEQKVRTSNLEASAEKAVKADLKVYLSGNATAAERKAADDKVIHSAKAVADEHTITSATIQANEAHNAAAAKKTTDTFSDFVGKFAGVNAAVTALVQARTLTISQSFQVLENDITAYFVSANKADGVNSKISSGILLIAAAIPALIPLIAALGVAWLTVQGYLVAETIVVGLSTFAVYLVGTVIPAVVSFGVAALLALGPIGAAIAVVTALVVTLGVQLGLIKNPITAITDLVKQFAGSATDAFNKAVVGAVDTAKATSQATAAVQGLTAATQQYKDVAGGPITSTEGGAHLDFTGDFGGGPSSGQGTPVPQLPTTGGDVPVLGGGRSGANFRVPGSGAPDTRLISFLASPGEQIIVRTPAQQVSGLPKFRDGGQLNVNKSSLNDAVTLGLSGLTINYVASGTNSLVGYNAPTPTAAQVATAASAPDTSTPSSSAADTASSATTSFTTPNSDTITAAEAASIAYYEKMTGRDPFAGTDAQRAEALRIMKKLGDPGGPQENLYVPFGNTNRAVRPINTWFDADHLTIDGNVIRGNLFSGTTFPTGGGFKREGKDPGLAPIVATARDGLDFTVPGTGAVDSRVLAMAVSPGEQVTVKTQAQQRAGGGSGNKTLIQNIAIQASDVDSYARSKKQMLRDLADKMQGAF